MGRGVHERLFSFLAAVAAAALLGAAPALAAVEAPAVPGGDGAGVSSLLARVPGCACEADREALTQQRDRIAAAGTLEEAQELALGETRLARRALGAARLMAPFSQDIREAHRRLDQYEQDVRATRSPEEAALAFGELVQVASLGTGILADVDVDLDDHSHGCSFSTGEIIAIVLGFLLGIIPGIILLILLC